MKVLPLQEYNKRLSEVEAKGDVKAYFKFIREHSCLYDAPPLKEEIIKEQQRIDREQMRILSDK